VRKRFKCGVRSAECGVRSAKSGIDDAWDSCLKMPAKRPLPAVSRRQTIFQPAFRNLCESPVAAVCDRQTILIMQCYGGHRPPLQCATGFYRDFSKGFWLGPAGQPYRFDGCAKVNRQCFSRARIRHQATYAKNKKPEGRPSGLIL